MLFRRRKTVELDRSDIESARDFGEAKSPYAEDGESRPAAFDAGFSDGGFDADEDDSDMSNDGEPSSVESGAWEYIHADPHEDYLTDTGNFHFEIGGPEGGVFLPETERDAPQGTGHVRKKHKKHHYLLKFFAVCTAAAVLYAFMMSSYFEVDAIDVEGTVNYSAAQIIEMSGLRLSDNIFEIRTGKAADKIEKDPHIASARIRRELPDTLHIVVTERLPAARVKNGEEEYINTDAAGCILSVGEAAEGTALITGVTVKGAAEPGASLKAEEGAALDEALSLIKAAGRAEFTFAELDMTGPTVRLYLSDTLLIKGRPKVILSHIENGDVRMILDDLAEKGITKGTIDATTEETFTFSPEIE